MEVFENMEGSLEIKRRSWGTRMTQSEKRVASWCLVIAIYLCKFMMCLKARIYKFLCSIEVVYGSMISRECTTPATAILLQMQKKLQVYPGPGK